MRVCSSRCSCGGYSCARWQGLRSLTGLSEPLQPRLLFDWRSSRVPCVPIGSLLACSAVCPHPQGALCGLVLHLVRGIVNHLETGGGRTCLGPSRPVCVAVHARSATISRQTMRTLGALPPSLLKHEVPAKRERRGGNPLDGSAMPRSHPQSTPGDGIRLAAYVAHLMA